MDSYYFTFWIKKYGKDNFKKLTDKVCRKITVPLDIKKNFNTDEFLFQYFYVVYYTVALNYFGLSEEQISFLIDLSLTPGTCKLFSPAEILEIQKDIIPEIIDFIKKDFEVYQKKNTSKE